MGIWEKVLLGCFNVIMIVIGCYVVIVGGAVYAWIFG